MFLIWPALFVRKYNVIILTLGDGALGNEFLAVSNLMFGPLIAEQRSPQFLTALFRNIADARISQVCNRQFHSFRDDIERLMGE